MKIAEFSVKHPAIIAISLISLLVFGLLALRALHSEMIPPVGLPQAMVITAYPGAASKDVERDISRLIENQLASIPGITELSSVSEASYSVVSLQFSDKTKVNEKIPQIRELLNGVADKLPEGIQGSPVIYAIEASSFLPIFSVRVKSDMPPEDLTKYLEDRLSPAIARIPGVSKINVVGGASREARISLKADELAARSVSPLSVYQALRYNNLSVPAGRARFRSKELSFTTDGSFSGLTDIGGLTIGYKDGSYIYLRDVADISLETAPRGAYIRSNGRDYVMVDVLKRDEGDTISIVGKARRALDELVADSAGSIEYSVISDQSETTKLSLNTVESSALTGLILTVLVILLVLHDLRATLIISLSIPLSVLFAILGLFGSGKSLNLLSLSGLTVAIGMIVDNSIVVLENTYNKFKETGDRRIAAIKGSDEVGGAVMASTITSVCVFAPLLFLTGIIGIIMNSLSLAIVFSLSASALVAVVIVPWLASLILKNQESGRRPGFLRAAEGMVDAALGRLEGAYRRLLERALGAKAFVISLALALLVASVILLSILKISFLPPTDTNEFEVHLETPAGYSLDQTRDKVDQIEARLSALVPEIEASAFYVGTGSTSTLTSTPNLAFGRIRLKGSDKRKRSVQRIVNLAQDDLSRNVADCNVTVLNGGFDALLAYGTGGQGYQMEIYGSDLESVVQTAKATKEFLDLDPDVFKTELSTRVDSVQLYADLSQAYMGSLGVSPYEAGLTSRILFNGMDCGSLHSASGDYPIRLCSDLSQGAVDDDTLNRLSLSTQDGRMLSFAAFSSVEPRAALSQINRKDRNFSISVKAYLRGEDQSGVSKRSAAAIKALKLPPGVKYQVAGSSKLISDSLASLSLMLAIGIFLVYVVMVIQFERFMQPLIIMAAIPFCLIGVVLGLYAFGSALSIIAMLAIISLGGTVVNNAIVLVDYTNLLRREHGLGLRQAIIQGGANRLRPILMTSLTTLFGVLPMALAKGNGSEVYAPLGQAIFGGLFSSTLITLVLVPVLYEILESRALARSAAKRTAGEEIKA